MKRASVRQFPYEHRDWCPACEGTGGEWAPYRTNDRSVPNLMVDSGVFCALAQYERYYRESINEAGLRSVRPIGCGHCSGRQSELSNQDIVILQDGS